MTQVKTDKDKLYVYDMFYFNVVDRNNGISMGNFTSREIVEAGYSWEDYLFFEIY